MVWNFNEFVKRTLRALKTLNILKNFQTLKIFKTNNTNRIYYMLPVVDLHFLCSLDQCTLLATCVNCWIRSIRCISNGGCSRWKPAEIRPTKWQSPSTFQRMISRRQEQTSRIRIAEYLHYSPASVFVHLTFSWVYLHKIRRGVSRTKICWRWYGSTIQKLFPSR